VPHSTSEGPTNPTTNVSAESRLSARAGGLPPHLAERVRPLRDAEPGDDADFVLYWAHHAVRAHENPALDVAIELAHRLSKPLLVYQGLGGSHRFDSDRHHAFIMQGARDAARALAERGVRHVFFLGARNEGPSPLPRLIDRSAVSVFEDFPAPPFPKWTRSLLMRTGAPIVAVDAACIVPMQSVGRLYDRAFKFRSKTKDEFDWRIQSDWPEREDVPPAFEGDLGFTPVDWGADDIPDLCTRCDVDHAVAPVPHTHGGSAAGYERWESFKSSGLKQYARRRNNAAVYEGVSRLSPYLHHGHVSPLRIAREAAAIGGDGPDKFLDELLIWREMAHNFCFYSDPNDLETLAILPDWARETLEKHAGDEREAIYDWEALARARTGDRLWNAAQRSLLIQGELHNNVRMTWGKALLEWTDSPQRALDMLIDLNHRYALDGNDPNSYAGLLWCLGALDRPFTPEKPVIGSVRPRSLESHAERLDLEKYESITSVPARPDRPRIGVIGAGIAGLMGARTLADHALDVAVFDKGRGPGGRASTRRQDDHRFDHGAQYFTARDERFKRYVDVWIDKGVAAEWDAHIVEIAEQPGQNRGAASGNARTTAPRAEIHDLPERKAKSTRYVGVPGMNAIAEHLAQDVNVHHGVRIAEVHRDEDADARWRLIDDQGGDAGRFDALLVTAPAPQTAGLLRTAAPNIARIADAVTMPPCWTLMLAFDRVLDLGFDAAFVRPGEGAEASTFSWIARDTSKPARPGAQGAGDDRWVLHASPEWSQANVERAPADVGEDLLAAFRSMFQIDAAPTFTRAHRWRHAQVENAPNEPCLFDPSLRLAVAGDWLLGGRIENAFLSGAAAAGRILSMPPVGEHAPESLFART